MNKPTVVYYYHTIQADTTRAAATAMDNLRAQGVDHIRATWDRKTETWIIEYKVAREDPA